MKAVDNTKMLAFMAQRIKELCKEREICLHELAVRSGLPPSTLYSILNGKSQNPGIGTLNRICATLDIKLKDLWVFE